jgi:uncharacterized protein YbjT (DUF2867 family)
MSSVSGADGPVLVTGATGLHGGGVAQALLAAGHGVRALTRNPDGRRARWLAGLGAELVLGELLVTDSLLAVMRGAQAVYAVTTPFDAGSQGEVGQGEHILAAACQAQVPWLILASVASANRATGIPHFESKWRIEQQLEASGIPHTVVAPSYFYENLGNPAEIVAAGELALPLSPSRPLQQLAVADLGALVVAVLARRDEILGERIEAASDQPTPLQMAATLQDAAGRPVGYRQLDTSAQSGDIAAMYSYLEQTGYQVDVDRLRARFPEVRWTSFAGWSRSAFAERLV